MWLEEAKDKEDLLLLCGSLDGQQSVIIAAMRVKLGDDVKATEQGAMGSLSEILAVVVVFIVLSSAFDDGLEKQLGPNSLNVKKLEEEGRFDTKALLW
eukprot:16420878-Heterocapsa_arctica.AAC.1